MDFFFFFFFFFFLRSSAHNSKVTDLIKQEFELVRDFMPELVTSKFDEDPIKNGDPIFPIIRLCEI